MAEIKVSSAFVEDVVSDREGNVFALRTSEPHRRKNEQGEWETTARTFRTVKASRDSGVDLSQFRKGDRVEFAGQEKTERRDKDGKTYYDLIVWVTGVSMAGSASGRQPEVAQDPWAQPVQDDQWASPDTAWSSTETPF